MDCPSGLPGRAVQSVPCCERHNRDTVTWSVDGPIGFKLPLNSLARSRRICYNLTSIWEWWESGQAPLFFVSEAEGPHQIRLTTVFCPDDYERGAHQNGGPRLPLVGEER
jgi:hypothetical protein